MAGPPGLDALLSPKEGSKFTRVQIYMDLNVLEDLNLVDGGPARNWSVFGAGNGFKIPRVSIANARQVAKRHVRTMCGLGEGSFTDADDTVQSWS